MSVCEAPELQTTHWFNADAPLTLASLRGRVVLIEAFQMLCPGCVSHGLPQAQRVATTFHKEDVAVIGVHTVFEHHAAQGSQEALQAFLHEYRITFPVGMDTPSDNGMLPKTMRAYGLQGTPSLLLIDHKGKLRKHKFGHEPDLLLGAEIMSLICEQRTNPPDPADEFSVARSGPKKQSV
ncbi:redoxin domain-containing protein [Parahaliea mediterranea]|uniref:redoxin domain-containing protein n=1 Tax=Parahaliea mediterranea TaxID=651086 RepID=UPI00187DEF08|nr:redoxin domain-containing protein [Parahaliea mediterranea]